MRNKSAFSVPVQSFHSLADPTVPYNGSFWAGWVGQEDMDALWRKRNGCGEELPRTTFNTSTTLCRRWDCPRAPVESCALKDIDHCERSVQASNSGFRHFAPGGIRLAEV